MNCKNAKELIVLYSELGHTEKSRVDEHLKTCTSCAKLLVTIQKQETIFRKAHTWNPEITDPVAFTDEILEALPEKNIPMKKEGNKIHELFGWSPLQTGLAACSLVLALTFTIEFNRPETPVQNQPVVKNGVTLTSDQEKLIQAKRIRTARFSLEKIIQQENTFALSK